VSNLKELLPPTSPIMTMLEVGGRVRKLVENDLSLFDCGKHYKSGDEYAYDFHLQEFLQNRLSYAFMDESVTLKDAKHLLAVLDGKKKADRWIALQTSSVFRCTECSENVALEFNGERIRCSNPCPYPKGMEPYCVEVNVISGMFVVANDLRDIFPVLGDFDVMTANGCKQVTEHYAKAGMAHAIVGNTCPTFFRLAPCKFIIGTTGPNGENPVKGARKVGHICTDLWWYSVCDYDEYVRRAGQEPPKEYGYDIVKCKPGVYRFKHLIHQVDREAGKQVFTEIDWVREPDPLEDLSAYWRDLDFTAGQILLDSIEEYPSLFRCKNLTDSVQRAANHLMTTLGNGADYHPNGFFGYRPTITKDSPEVKIPIFRKKYNWYPLYEDSNLGAAAGINRKKGHRIFPEDLYLNPSFRDLAFNICHCAAKYGCAGRDGAKSQKVAMKCLLGLAKKHPDNVPGYVKKFLKEQKRG
jgi:hypothetical protein